MKNVSIDELTKVLEKSGLPSGNGASMTQALTGARDPIAKTVYGADSKLPAYQTNYKSQLSQIASMDQKLQGVYADPSSPLFIEHPLKREGFYAGAENRGYGAAGTFQNMAKSQQSELDNEINDALSVYGEFAKQTRTAEKEYEKNQKEIQKQQKKMNTKTTTKSKKTSSKTNLDFNTLLEEYNGTGPGPSSGLEDLFSQFIGR